MLLDAAFLLGLAAQFGIFQFCNQGCFIDVHRLLLSSLYDYYLLRRSC